MVFVFTGGPVKECFWVGAAFILCFFTSNFFLFRSTSGSPLVVTFVESLCLRGPEASGESIGVGLGCGMWFYFLQCNFFLWINATGTVQWEALPCALPPSVCWAVPNTH